ncbi:putative abieta-7,13-dien-18-ol hydroxylase [Lupinus albus]|uniref:Putative abieta-7,13-dien-18-ol hydroxylase n=1 Tax=Lupinus albus TaxID=3870 RepID=A0A6A4QMB4_LUPAL|nr:putative abieta-7,13-dien-18-ol hydroxylase [Lupinus albus]
MGPSTYMLLTHPLLHNMRLLNSHLEYPTQGMIQGESGEKEVIGNVVLLVLAAHDTNSFAVAMTFKMLGQHPHCYSELLQGNIVLAFHAVQNHYPSL